MFSNQSNHSAFAAVLEDVPALVLIETPSNPLMRVVDIAALASKAKAAGAMVAVDNTFLSPALQRPITLGADFVIHSTDRTSVVSGKRVLVRVDLVGGRFLKKKKNKRN